MPDSDNTDDSDGAGRTTSGRRLNYPKRISLDVTEDDNALQGVRYAVRVSMADRIRALVSWWQEDPAVAVAVSIRALEQFLVAGPQLDHPRPSSPDAGPAVPPAS